MPNESDKLSNPSLLEVAEFPPQLIFAPQFERNLQRRCSAPSARADLRRTRQGVGSSP